MRLLHLLLLVAGTTTASAIALNEPSPTPSPTVVPRADSPSTTAVPTGNFLTTKYETIKGVTQDHVTIPEKTIILVLPTCVQTITPDKNGYLPPGTCNSLYDYYPSFAGAVITTAVFAVLSGIHIWLAAKCKASYCWVLIMGTIWETVAFATRAISTRYQQSSALELISTLFILLAPLWINAHAYINLSHLIYTVHPKRSILQIPAQTLSTLFVVLDFSSFIIQLIGGSSSSPTASESQIMKGIHIYMGGIGLQQFFIVLFIGLSIKFHTEMNAIERMQTASMIRQKRDWRKLLYATYTSLGFITIRIIFRLVQFNTGHDPSTNALVGKEAYLYVLEALPMMGAITCFIVVHPGTIVEAHMPGIWQAMKGRCCAWRKTRGNRGRQLDGEDDMKKLTAGSYLELEN